MPNKRKKRVSLDDLGKPTKKLTPREQEKVKGGLIIPGPHLSNTIGGALSNTIGGGLSNTIGGGLRR